MARDPRVRMRSGLVVPGVLLTLFGTLAIVYAEIFRAQSDFCPDGTWILIAGICYTVWKLILPIVLIGIALTITGAVAFRGYPEDLEGHLQHGTPSHTALAVLISFVAGPALFWVIQVIRQSIFDTTYELTFLGARWEHTFLLELAMLLGLLGLLPYLFLYIGVGRRRRLFVAAATAALEEHPAKPETRPRFEDTIGGAQHQESEMLPDEDWPADREPRAGSGFVGCAAQEGARSCPEPVRPGTRYCSTHGCAGLTKDGKACGNLAVAAGLCEVHQAAD